MWVKWVHKEYIVDDKQELGRKRQEVLSIFISFGG